LILDGQNNHSWKETTPILKAILEAENTFAVDVATSPPAGGDMTGFHPNLEPYAVIVSNYNGERWSPAFEKAFEDYVKNGGGFVSVHAANNAFPEWKAYNEMIGVGGWGGRDETSGPWLYWEEKIVRDTSVGRGGSHGKQHAFQMFVRAPEHVIMRGIPQKWMHAQDELYDRLRGPAENLTVLATAYSDPATGGTGKHEPLLFALTCGRGRVFHTALGHGLPALRCVGFATTLRRGTEWAATGRVTQQVPEGFPTADAVSTWE
jgi:type 1 glutamine amidotransferase